MRPTKSKSWFTRLAKCCRCTWQI